MKHKAWIYYLIISILICSYLLFESTCIPFKADTNAHLFKIYNLTESFKDLKFLIPWHNNPYFGYPEHYIFFLPYLITSILIIIFGYSFGFKLSFVLAYFLMGLLTHKAVKNLFQSKNKTATVITTLYMLNPYIFIFGIAAGSINRIFAFALFPFTLSLIKSLLENPKNKLSIISLGIGLTLLYFSHPIFLCYLIILFPIIFGFFRKNQIKDYLKAFSLSSLIFVALSLWQILPFLSGLHFISWPALKDYVYSDFINTPLSIKSFFEFSFNAENRPLTYFGTIILVILIIGTIKNFKVKKHQKKIAFPLLIIFTGVVLVLLHPQLIKISFYKNNFQSISRHFYIINIGVIFLAGFYLSQIKKTTYKYIIIAIFVFESFLPFLHWSGSDYLNQNNLIELNSLKNLKSENIQKYQIDYNIYDYNDNALNHFLFLNNYFLSPVNKKLPFPSIHGFWEISPHNLGRLFRYLNLGDNQNSFQAFLGISQKAKLDQDNKLKLIKNPEYRGNVHQYKNYITIKSSNKEKIFEEIYVPLLYQEDFDPLEMPIIFLKNNNNQSISQNKILNTFKEQESSHLSTLKYQNDQIIFEIKGIKDNLIVLTEAYHPRRKIILENQKIASFSVEPGLIGFILPETGEFKGKIINQFLLHEKISFYLSGIFGVFLLAYLIKKKKIK